MQFNEKVILITGAASCLGAATAIKFSQLNAHMALVDEDDEKLREILTLCEQKSGRKHLAIVADLSKVEDLLNVVPRTVEKFGRIDVLINTSVFFLQDGSTDEDMLQKYDKVVDSNLKAPVMLTNKAAPYLIESKGSIINIGSIRSSRPSHKQILYATSKAGLDMFTKCVALDLADRGVRANSVHPGMVRLANSHKIYNSSLYSDNFFDEKGKLFPFGLIEPEEVVKLILFLANNEDARSITGASYYIDGGIALMETASIGGKY